jgi:hypothetical protein
MAIYKFSGHETFQCRHFWPKKGVDFLASGGNFRSEAATTELGVGKNMVASINYWLRAMGVVNDLGEMTEFGIRLYGEAGFDPYLEDISTLFLLHFNLMRNESYASIYKLTFEDFRRTRISSDFTEEQLFEFITRTLKQKEETVSDKTLLNDIKVLIKSYYCDVQHGSKSIEDDLSSVFINLGFIQKIEIPGDKIVQYRINFGVQPLLHPLVLLTCIVDVFEESTSISVEDIQKQVSDKLLCNAEGTDSKLTYLADKGYIIYKQDAGRREIQMKKNLNRWELLAKYYGNI